MRADRPVGVITRGTTGPNRLRRMDRALAHVGESLLRRPGRPPLVVDLGYGAAATTTVELHRRLSAIRRDVEVVGVEIDPERVRSAARFTRPGLRFVHGGFDLAGLRAPTLVRAANVLRQYDEADVPAAWGLLVDRLAPDGLLLEGTCDEVGRRATWVWLDRAGPRSLTLSVAFGAIDRPSDVAERLPKALIHRNVPGEGVHALLREIDDAWARTASWAPYGPRAHAVEALGVVAGRWPVVGDSRRWRLGELSVAWDAVAPASPAPAIPT